MGQKIVAGRVAALCIAVFMLFCLLSGGCAPTKGQILAAESSGDVTVLIAGLRHSDPSYRARAARGLGETGDARAVEPLIAVLKHDRDIRQSAAMALGRIGDARAVEPLIEALHDKNDWVRRNAAEALGEIGDARAVEPLMIALKDDKQAAATILSKFGASAVAPLMIALNDPDYRVKNNARDALIKIGVPAVPPLVDVFEFRRPGWGDAKEILVKIGGPAVEPLFTVVCRGENANIQQHATLALIRIGEPAVFPLIDALSNEDREVRRRAVNILGRIGDARAVEPIIATVLNDEDWMVRQDAAEALGKIGNARAVESLITTVLNDQNTKVRCGAVRSLGKIGDVRAVEPLIAALEDNDRAVRLRAAAALGEIDDSRAVEPLMAVLKDKDRWARWYVSYASSGMEFGGGHGYQVESLIAALGKLGDARAVVPLIALLKDKDRNLRSNASEALGRIGDTRAVVPLIAALHDKDGWVRRNAAEALGRIGDIRAVEPLIAALPEDKDRAVWALKEITGADFGDDPEKWQEWWRKNKNSVLKK